MIIQVFYCYQTSSRELHTLIGQVQLVNCLVSCTMKQVLYCVTTAHNTILRPNQVPIQIQYYRLSL